MFKKLPRLCEDEPGEGGGTVCIPDPYATPEYLSVSDSYPEVFILNSTDGKSGSWKSTVRDDSASEAYGRYLTRYTGINHSVMIKGHFNLNSVVLTFSPAGGR